MSRTIDERVVSMQFDNKNFESNVATSLSTLDKLKRSLNLSGAAKGLEDINSAAGRVDMSALGSGVEAVRLKFSSLQVMAVTALSNITNSAVNAGKRIVSALTIDPIKEGFNEYETKINSIQTIMSNTANKGTTMEDVTRVIDELNTYADKTIYNFAEMTRNIGTFTAAGVGLEESASAIQGIANLAAASGSNSQQASTAMYQLSQAMAAGTVKLMDWNSVVNAGMGGEKFQEALKATAREHGIAVDSMIKENGSFRESLQEGWLSADILNETLNKFTVDGATKYAKSMMESGKWTKEQADALIKEAQSMEDAATKVKTFTQLWDTLKEAAQSGWGKSWEIIVGDFEEAKELFTEISDVLGGLIGKSADSRNKVLQGWKDLGGRTAVIDSLRNAFEGVSSIVKPISEAFREIFPPITSQKLYDFSVGLKNLTERLKMSDETANKVKRTFKGVFSIFDIVRKAITSVVKALFDLSGSEGIASLGDLFLDVAASIGDFFTSLNENFNTDGISGILSSFSSLISDAFGKATEEIRSFGDIFSAIGNVISKVAGGIWNAIKEVFTWIADNVSAGDVFAGLAGGGIFVLAKKVAGVFGKIKDVLDSIFGGGKSDKLDIGAKFADILDSVHGALESFTAGIKATSLLSIAIAIGILSASLNSISKLEAVDISKSLLAIGSMFAMLNLSFRSISKTLTKFDSKGIVKSGFALILVAGAIKILGDAMEKIGSLSLPEITKGLIGIGGGLVELSVGLKIIGKTKISLSTSVAMLALAESCKILGDALKKFAKMSWEEIGRGLSAMGGALGEFVIALGVLSKVGGGGSLLGSVGILIAVQSLDELSENLEKFAKMSWEEIGRGLSAMGGALGELGLALGALGKLSGFSSVLASGAILIAVQSLGKLADALKRFAGMTWEEIGRGLSGMGGALGEVAIITGVLGKLTGLSGLLGAGSILIGVQGLGDLADALKRFGGMSWEEIGRGLVGMGGALGEVAIISGTLGSLAPLGGLVGSGSLLLGIQGLGDLADALKKFGEMNWDEIGRGLSAMGGALGEVALGGLLNTLSGLGSLSISAIAEPLGTLADSVKKWSNVTLPENLSAQLGELANGVMSFTFGGFGADALATAAPAVGIMADSIRKWSGVTVPDGLGERISSLASGVEAFTFGGFGASALSTAAPAIGTMADSVRKWTSISIPENLEQGLKQIANGVGAFSFAFMGGWSLSALVGPLGTLSDSVKKWNGVAIPEGLEEKLKSIASGIKAFSFAFMGGWSISAIVEPLGSLAGSVKKWNGVVVPDGLKDKLKSLADGVKSFSLAFVGGWSIGQIVDPLKNLAGAVKKWNGVTIPSEIGDKLKSLASGVKSFSGIGDISSVSSSMNTIASAASKLSGINFQSISSGLTSFVTSASKLDSLSSSLENIGKNIVNGFVSAIRNGEVQVRTAVTSLATSAVLSFSIAIVGASSIASMAGQSMANSLATGLSSGASIIPATMGKIINSTLNAIRKTVPTFRTSGRLISTQFVNGIKSNASQISNCLINPIKQALATIRSYYSSFYSAGAYLVEGFANGITANTFMAEARARAMALAALQAAKNALGVASPSKEFYKIGKFTGIGFINALHDYGSKVYDAGSEMAYSARSGMSNAIGRIAEVINSDIDTQPTIRPVLDLSDVAAGAGAINGMFGTTPIGVLSNIGAISSMMNQNDRNSDVVSAIDKLRKDLSNAGNTTIVVDGVTYDDGSNVSEAVKSIVRAAKVERRI